MRNTKQYWGIDERKLNYLNVFLPEMRGIKVDKFRKYVY